VFAHAGGVWGNETNGRFSGDYRNVTKGKEIASWHGLRVRRQSIETAYQRFNYDIAT